MLFGGCGPQSGHVRNAHFSVKRALLALSTTKVVFTSTTFAELTAAGSSPNFGFRTHAAKSFFGDGRKTSVPLSLLSWACGLARNSLRVSPFFLGNSELAPLLHLKLHTNCNFLGIDPEP